MQVVVKHSQLVKHDFYRGSGGMTPQENFEDIAFSAVADPGWGIWGKSSPPPLQEIAYKIEIL